MGFQLGLRPPDAAGRKLEDSTRKTGHIHLGKISEPRDWPPHSNKGNGRSETSYTSAGSLFRRTTKRNSSKREAGSAIIVDITVRTDPQLSRTKPSQDGHKTSPCAPLFAEVQDEAADVIGHETKFTYVTPQLHQQAQPSSSRQKPAEAQDSAAPFYSY